VKNLVHARAARWSLDEVDGVLAMRIKNWWPGLLLLTLVGYLFVYPFVWIQWNLYRCSHIRDELVPAMQHRYPKLHIEGGTSYERAVVYLRVRGAIDPAQQAEIRQFIASWKAEHDIKVEVWLKFNDQDTEEDAIKL
jgi:hypothetical protein